MSATIRRFRFSYRAVLPPHAAGDHLRAWFPSPISSDYQTVESSEVDAPYPAQPSGDELLGNTGYYFEPPPSAVPTTITFNYTVTRRLRQSVFPPSFDRVDFEPGLVERPDMERYLAPNINVPIEGFIAYQARSIASSADPPAFRARAVFDHLIDTLNYDWAGCTPDRVADLGNLKQACDLRTGTCTEWHGLYVGYLRALQVPSQFCFGFNLPRKPPPESAHPADGPRSQQIKGYHCWAEVLLPLAGWIPVDVTEGYKATAGLDVENISPEKRAFYFGGLDCNRIQFHVGRDLELRPRQDGPAVDKWIFGHAEVRGKPFHISELTFSCTDLDDEPA